MKNRKSATAKRISPWFYFWAVALYLFAVVTMSLSPASVTLANTAGNQLVETRETTCLDVQDAQRCKGLQVLDKVLNFFAIIIVPICGVLITIAGVQYMVSRNNPEVSAAARMRIYKVILALVMFAGMWTFLKWLIPGGALQ